VASARNVVRPPGRVASTLARQATSAARRDLA